MDNIFRNYYFWTLVLLFPYACLHDYKAGTPDINSNKILDAGSYSQIVINAHNIYGIWAESEEDNAILWISGDSMYYTEDQGNPLKYEIRNDSLIIFYDGLTTRNKILKLDTDSLVFKTEVDCIVRLYKRK